MERCDITVIIPAHNEAENIERCVQSVSGWAQTVIVLSSSTDETDEIAKRSGAAVIRVKLEKTHPFVGVQRAFNEALKKVTTGWAFRLDADEVMTEMIKKEISEKISTHSNIVAYGVPRLQYFWGGFLRGGDWSRDRLVRLFRPHSVHYDLSSHVHEQFRVNGKQSVLTQPLEHYSHPTLAVALKKFNDYTSSEIEDMDLSIEAARLKLLWRPPYVLLRWLFWSGGVRDGLRGFVAGVFRAFYEFMLYAKYIEWRLLSNSQELHKEE